MVEDDISRKSQAEEIVSVTSLHALTGCEVGEEEKHLLTQPMALVSRSKTLKNQQDPCWTPGAQEQKTT